MSETIKITGSGCDTSPAGTTDMEVMMKSAFESALYSVIQQALSHPDVVKENEVNGDELSSYLGSVEDVGPKNGIFGDSSSFEEDAISLTSSLTLLPFCP